MDIQFEIETMEGSVRLPVDLRNAQRLEVAIGGSRFAFSYDARGEKLNATLEVLAGNGALFGTLLFNITSWIAINYILTHPGQSNIGMGPTQGFWGTGVA